MSDAKPPLPPAAPQPTVHHVSRRRRRGRPRPAMQVNLSAMIDVIFNLLIFFVVTASFAADEGMLSMRLPVGSGQPPVGAAPPVQPIRIRVESAGPAGIAARLQIQNERVDGSFPVLEDRLATMRFGADNPLGIYEADNPVVIHPGPEVRWQHVVNAFNAAARAGYTNVRFAEAAP